MGSVVLITSEIVAQAKINRAARLLRETNQKIDPDSIADTDLVFRVLTWQHIPLLPPKPLKVSKKLAARKDSINKFFEEISTEDTADDIELETIEESTEWAQTDTVKSDHIRINFPPFWHYRFDSSGELVVIGKSHWLGTLDSGEFSKTHGEMTDTLARMLMKLTEKYALKGNWRNYTYRDEMQGQAVLQLCQVALQFDESKSQNPFSFFTQIAQNSFRRILGIEKKNQEIRDDLLIRNNMNPSYSRSNKDANAVYDGYSD